MPNPNDLLQLFGGGSQSANSNFESASIDTKGIDRLFIQLLTEDSMTGTLKLVASNLDEDGTFAELEDTDLAVNGTDTSYGYNVYEIGMRYIRIRWANIGGTGNFTGNYHQVDDK